MGATPITLREAVEHYAETAITEHGLRQAIKRGELPCRMIGRKIMLTIENIDKWAEGELAPQPMEAAGGIRRQDA